MGDVGSILIGIALIVSSIFILYKLVRKQMKGEGCTGCSGCSHAASCNIYKENKE